MYGETMVVPDSVKNLPEQVDKLLKMIKDSHDKMEFLEKEMFQIKNLEESILKRQKNKRKNLPLKVTVEICTLYNSVHFLITVLITATWKS